jgi:hypothetical protein
LNQGAISRTTDTAMWMSHDELSVLLNRVSSNETSFSNDELWKLVGFLRVNVLNLQDAFVQHKERLLDQATLEQAVRAFQFWIQRPIMRALYRVLRDNIATDTRRYIDKLLDSLPPGEALDLQAATQVALES